MRHYELMVILDPDLEERTVGPSLDQYLTVVRNDGGTVENVDVWGRRRFAYTINHKQEGVYTVLEIVTDAPNLDDVDRFLRLADEVVRHKLFRLPDSEATRRGLLGAAPAEA